MSNIPLVTSLIYCSPLLSSITKYSSKFPKIFLLLYSTNSFKTSSHLPSKNPSLKWWNQRSTISSNDIVVIVDNVGVLTILTITAFLYFRPQLETSQKLSITIFYQSFHSFQKLALHNKLTYLIHSFVIIVKYKGIHYHRRMD